MEQLTEKQMSDLVHRAGTVIKACRDYRSDYPYGVTMVTRNQYEIACRATGVQAMSDEDVLKVDIANNPGNIPRGTREFFALCLADWRRRRIVFDEANQPLF